MTSLALSDWSVSMLMLLPCALCNVQLGCVSKVQADPSHLAANSRKPAAKWATHNKAPEQLLFVSTKVQAHSCRIADSEIWMILAELQQS